MFALVWLYFWIPLTTGTCWALQHPLWAESHSKALTKRNLEQTFCPLQVSALQVPTSPSICSVETKWCSSFNFATSDPTTAVGTITQGFHWFGTRKKPVSQKLTLTGQILSVAGKKKKGASAFLKSLCRDQPTGEYAKTNEITGTNGSR